MADPTSDTPTPNTPEDVRPRATIKLKPMTPPAPAADAAAPAATGAAADAASAEPAARISPSPAAAVPGIKQTIRLRPPTAAPAGAPASSEAKPAIKIVPKAAETPTGIPTAKPVESAPSTSTIQLKKPESSTPTIQLKKPESSTPTIQLKKPESSTPTIQLKKPESSAAPAKKVGEAPVPPERKLTLKLKNQPSQPKELPKNIIPGLNIPNMPPQAPQQKQEEQKPAEAAQQAEQPPVAAPVETPTPVPEAVPEDNKKKGKLPKVKKQKAPVTSADEPNWFFLTLSILTLICVCFIAYLLFAQYMNMYQGQQIPVPGFLLPK
ncbi:MAG: hypothetical protein IKC53_06155 [Lentisphaeria bacterium]|nr:hypothetical protein [Lentisphaeria bacterium]MBR3688591.1 hypothetical protein [Lentisphaeria bacterium]